MSDFSLFSLFTAGLALYAPFATAYTKPTGDAPVGNPISQPGFMSIVPAGEKFTVTWEPTTQGTVSLVLLKGPSENAVPQYAIAEKVPNSGTYVWSVKDDIEPSEGAEGYGIQLIDDKTGQYQYTTQFGISNDDYKPEDSESTSSAAPSSTKSAAGGYGHGGHGNGGHGHGSHNVHGGYTHPAASGTASASIPTSYHGNGTTSGIAQSTGTIKQNVTMIQATGGYTTKTRAAAGPTSYSNVDSSSTPTESVPAQATGNSAAVMVSSFGGLVLAAGAAVFAL